MKLLAGIDGCRTGWVAAIGALESDGCFTFREFLIRESLGEYLQDSAYELIAIDIPMGLAASAEHGGRLCDIEARRLLGKRGCCVFSPPVREAVYADSDEKAKTININSSKQRIGVSKQALAIRGKIREADELMYGMPYPPQNVFEVHPELCFSTMNRDRAIPVSKKKPQGQQMRHEILQRCLQDGGACAFDSCWRFCGAIDDRLDALAALWTAGRIYRRQAEQLPADVIMSQDIGVIWR
jgi:predicted RNase H-like nuclease